MFHPHLFLSFIFGTMSIMALETVFLSLFHSLCYFSFLSFFHVQEQAENSWFLDVKDWKYTSILQQWSFAHCQNRMEHIRLGWQAYRIPGGTHHKCKESKKFETLQTLTNICSLHSHFALCTSAMAAVPHADFVQYSLQNFTLLRQHQVQDPIEIRSLVNIITPERGENAF
jgi:hypothetical protein